MVGGRCRRWSVIGGRFLHFTGQSSQFLFLRMVGGRRLNQYMVDGRWLMVGGLLSVVLYYARQTKTFLNICETVHRMDKHKSSVFPRQYRNCFSRRINALVLRN